MRAAISLEDRSSGKVLIDSLRLLMTSWLAAQWDKLMFSHRKDMRVNLRRRAQHVRSHMRCGMCVCDCVWFLFLAVLACLIVVWVFFFVCFVCVTDRVVCVWRVCVCVCPRFGSGLHLSAAHVEIFQCDCVLLHIGSLDSSCCSVTRVASQPTKKAWHRQQYLLRMRHTKE